MMGQVSKSLRNLSDGHAMWCAGCEQMHRLPDSWQFNGNLEKPTFTPSFLHSGVKRIFVNGAWNGEWVMDSAGNPVKYICHYILTDGIVNYCPDSTHALAGKSVPIADLPDDYRDEE